MEISPLSLSGTNDMLTFGRTMRMMRKQPTKIRMITMPLNLRITPSVRP